MREVRLSAEAYRDFDAVVEHTVDRFGHRQADAYADRLIMAMERLKQNPHLGTNLGKALPGARRLVHESHSIYYHVTDSSIIILRILGPGQDPSIELS